MTIEGETFDGPPEVSVKPGETLEYPLTFKPVLEREVMVWTHWYCLPSVSVSIKQHITLTYIIYDKSFFR